MQVQKFGSVGTEGIENPEFFDIENPSIIHMTGKFILKNGQIISAVDVYDGHGVTQFQLMRTTQNGDPVVICKAPFVQPGRTSLLINERGWDGKDDKAIPYIFIQPEELPDDLKFLLKFEDSEKIKFVGVYSGNLTFGIRPDGKVVKYSWNSATEGFIASHWACDCKSDCCGERLCKHSWHIAYDKEAFDVVFSVGAGLLIEWCSTPSEEQVLRDFVELVALNRRSGAFPSTGTYEGDIAPLRKPVDRLSALASIGRVLDENIREIKITRSITPSGSPQGKSHVDSYWAAIDKSYPQYTTGEPASEVIENLTRKTDETLVSFHARAKARADEVNS